MSELEKVHNKQSSGIKYRFDSLTYICLAQSYDYCAAVGKCLLEGRCFFLNAIGNDFNLFE